MKWRVLSKEVANAGQWFPLFFQNRVPIVASLILLALAAVFGLPSQSGSSFFTYLLAVSMLIGVRSWAQLWRDRTFLCVVAVSFYIALTSFWSVPFDSRDAISQFIRALLQVCFVVAVVESMRIDWFRTRLVATMAVCGGMAAVAALLIFSLNKGEGVRLNGLGQLDTHVRAALVFGVSLVCALSWGAETHSIRVRLLAAAIAICLGLAVSLSGSRAAWVAVSFGCAMYFISRATKSRSRFLIFSALLAVMGVVALVATWNFPELRTLVFPRGDSYRVEIWGQTIRQILDHGLWFGRGVLTDDDVLVGGFVSQHPHNLYLAILFQGGILGLSIFAMLMWSSLAALLRRFDDEEARLGFAILAIALPAYLLDGFELVDKIGWTWILIWLPVAMSIGVGRGHTPAKTSTDGA